MLDVLRINLCSPLSLAFVLGVFSRLVRSELSLPRELYASLSIYLLLALGLKGGVELSHSTFNELVWPAVVTIGLGCLTPVTSYLALRKLGKFGVADAAGIAAHYGSVSAVTFIAAQQFVQTMGHPAEGYMPTLLTLLESPGIHIALGIGAIQTARLAAQQPASGTDIDSKRRPLSEVLHEVLTARSMILLVGGLVVGCIMGVKGYEPVKPFFEGMFKGALTLFLLEMGLSAGARLGDLKTAGPFLLGFGMVMPVIHGVLGVLLGHWAGLSIGGATVLGTMAASASYIAAPPAVRMTLPEANPTLYLTAALAITFPFNIVLGIPLYFQVAKMLGGQ
ncbi:MAG: sodium-dependent bicarbonate transport family permease [Planctomycetaceae bacterium]|nr:sodium-dependent bicarbonate transport family permease [Planctomycetaceae bacterium]